MNPVVIAIAGQNTAGSMLPSLSVVDMPYPSRFLCGNVSLWMFNCSSAPFSRGWPAYSCDPVRRIAAVEKRGDILDHLHAHGRPRLGRCAAEVRKKHHVFEIRQGGWDRRLVLIDIEPGASDCPLLQGLDEGHGIDDIAARGIDEKCARLHQREPPRVYQMSVLGTAGAVERDEVARRHHLVDRLHLL